MKVVVAPDSFGGTLSATAAAEAIAAGWTRAREDDEVVRVPLADGGEGTLDVVEATLGGERHEVEVADPHGKPVRAEWLALPDGSAVVESARACGLDLLDRDERNPLEATTYGVGQLLEDVRRAGTERVRVGLGGSATVDGGAGAAIALGVQTVREDGSGLKVGGGYLVDVVAVRLRWLDPAWRDIDVTLWSDVDTVLADAAATFGPQKGATPDAVRALAKGLERWADVVERDLDGSWRDEPGSGAAGGLGFGLAAVLGARFTSGVGAVARLVGLEDALADADVVVTGEGALDATSERGKVVGSVVRSAREHGIRPAAVVGRHLGDVEGLDDVEVAAPGGPGHEPALEVAAAAERLAVRL